MVFIRSETDTENAIQNIYEHVLELYFQYLVKFV